MVDLRVSIHEKGSTRDFPLHPQSHPEEVLDEWRNQAGRMGGTLGYLGSTWRRGDLCLDYELQAEHVDVQTQVSADVLLVQPFFPFADREAISIPLGMGYMATVLTDDGLTVATLDCSVEPDLTTWLNLTRIDCPIIGVQLHSTHSLQFCHYALRRIRKLAPESLVVVGGELASTKCGDLLASGLADVAVLGEGETALAVICNAHARGDSLDKVPGVAVLSESGELVRTPAPRMPKDLDLFGHPSIDHFRWEAYGQWTLMSSRGCPYRCTYCSSAAFWSHTIRYHSVDWVLDEFVRLAGYGAQDVYVADDTFTMNRSRVLEICQRLEALGSGVGWSCLTRVDRLDEELARSLRLGGCKQVSFGYESSNDSTLQLVNKRATSDQAVQVMDLCRAEGIRTRVSVILGLPGETYDDVMRTFDHLVRMRPNEIQLYAITPHDGTVLFDNLEAFGLKIVQPDPLLWTRDVRSPVCESRTLSASQVAELGLHALEWFSSLGWQNLHEVAGPKKIGAEHTIGTAFTPVQGVRSIKREAQ